MEDLLSPVENRWSLVGVARATGCPSLSLEAVAPIADGFVCLSPQAASRYSPLSTGDPMARSPHLLLACLPALVGADGPLEPPVLGEARPLTEAAAWGELAWSPDGHQLSIHGEGGLWTLSLQGGALEPVDGSEGQVVFRHRWPGSPAPAAELPAVRAQRDDIWLRSGGQERRLTQGEDRFYDPVLSPDGQRVAFSGLVTGLHVLDLSSGTLTHLGAGRWPSWHPEGTWLVFERNADDGHDLTEAELLLWHPHMDAAQPLTDDPATMDRFPAFSPDGDQLAWVRDGAVWLAPIERVAP